MACQVLEAIGMPGMLDIAWKVEGAKTDKPQDMLRQPPYTGLSVSPSYDFSECPLGQNQSHTGHN